MYYEKLIGGLGDGQTMPKFPNMTMAFICYILGNPQVSNIEYVDSEPVSKI